MALYFAFPFFFYCLARSYKRPIKVICAIIGAILALVIVLGPFYHLEGIKGLYKIAEKVLPLRRRIFEDKVSSFWCVLHNFIKVNYWNTDL